MTNDYKSAGVDVEAGYKSVELIKEHVKKTFRNEVLSDVGGFGGLFSIAKAKNMEDPVLVSGTDGVGTKLKLAFIMDKHDTVGIDCVAMCVNDIVCSGAEPLFFLDYIACGKNYPEKIAEIVKGISDGCLMSNCSLIGGETAEMPGFYPVNEYDLAGFSVGILDKSKVIDGSKVSNGDVIIGLQSSGLHSNGFSLVRKILRPSEQNVKQYIESIGNNLGEVLLIPTKIYVKPILDLISKTRVKGICHITGGGFIENIPRILPKDKKAVIECGTWDIPPIFNLLEKDGELDKMGMYNTFNMGIGMTIIVSENDVDNALNSLKASGETPFVIGRIVEGQGIDICLK